jgi:membrane protease YdiL (CAAX protease family)
VAAFARYPGLPFLPLAAVFDVVLLAVGFGQEIGWRGLALPRLQARLGPLRGAIAVAVPWGIWLLPLLLVNRAWQVPGRPPVVVLLGSALLLVSSSIVLAFVVARSKGSLAAAAIWHACLRIATATEGGAGVVGDGMIAAVFVGAVLVVAAEHGARQVGRSLLAVPNPVRGAGARRHEPPAVRPT